MCPLSTMSVSNKVAARKNQVFIGKHNSLIIKYEVEASLFMKLYDKNRHFSLKIMNIKDILVSKAPTSMKILRNSIFSYRMWFIKISVFYFCTQRYFQYLIHMYRK